VPEYNTLTSTEQIGTPTDSYYPNQGVYRRDFTNGLVLVNPSSKSSFTVTLPPGTWKDLYGHTEGPTVTLEPATEAYRERNIDSAIILVR
jgi:hypothetical protein